MKKRYLPILFSLTTAVAALLLCLQLTPTQASQPHIGYGANVAEWDTDLLSQMGFDWIKVFNPPTYDLPQQVLLRIDATHAQLSDITAFADGVEAVAQNHGDYIDAYEIGNEPNLDASYGWAAPPIAADYQQLLCAAYDRIKAVDPTAVVVSAGLAPTGRVSGDWNGHPGHNGLYQDEREYLRELLAGGAGNCFDALGYHPYGYRANFDAVPDVLSDDPDQNCSNGFCFRGVEKIYEIMDTEYNLGHKSVWATEFGWIIAPPDHCLSDPGWAGRQWQLVSPQVQATNLVGAYQYADAHYPWMGGMFLFNLNFNLAPYYPECEQMRFYGVADRPAQAALTDMAKNPVGETPPGIHLPQASVTFMVEEAQLPLTLTFDLPLQNLALTGTVAYTLTAVPTHTLQPILSPATGIITAGQTITVTGLITDVLYPIGYYQGELLLESDTAVTATVPIHLWVVDRRYDLFLPIITR